MTHRSLASFATLLALGVTAFAQEPKFQSKVINRQTPGHAVDIDVDVTGAKELYLVVRDGGDGFGADWADWAEPRLVTASGEKKLTEMKWKSAGADWGNVAINKNANGDAMKIAGKTVEYGIGTHANSVIAFDLPEGTTRFKARGGIDNGGSDQPLGSSIQFAVYTQKPPVQVAQAGGGGGGGSREPKDAISGLDIAEGLEATLFASEASNPAMLNPTSIDIDHLGRVWVCEVVNYRHRKGERKEGDRILVLEDTNGDGAVDKQSVFHQGNDVDTAHGICVLPTPTGKGTKVIISVGSEVFYLHDDDGDLKSDRKELLFTGIEGTQHDHGIHAFHFGPDGKLYFNFGNSGRRIKDKDGKQIVDMSGREVHDHRKPYQEGMVFRCNMDGSEFETLGWNFRNNWEIAVDSFGTLWQSDNDDDGNKGVRINFVMEFGDYGYKDQITGAGWQSPRTNMETEIPLRHWHLNDPGTVPNLLQTGAGSPTGILVYEGDLLPKVFHNQIIHCDAGPNVVRSYPVKKSGAGYTAETVNILTGARDNWFRPSDVCVAPDGSLFVADWYDPGVGGHRMGDADRGRLFRLAPPKTPYKVAKVDVSTVEGAIVALKSPNEATRYLAFTALRAMPFDKVQQQLDGVFSASKNEVHRARALMVLANFPNMAGQYVDLAIRDRNPDIRIVGLRLARQHKLDMAKVVEKLANDPAAEVRRECLVALRHLKSDAKGELWARLTMQHNGYDRWYLEAIGLAADNDWDACLAAIRKLAGDDARPEIAFALPIGRDLIWRARATGEGNNTAMALAMLVATDHVSADDAPRYLRAFDFQPPSPQKDEALVKLAFGSFGDEAKTKFINTEAISRLKGFDVSKNPDQLAALNRVLDGVKGQPQFITLVEKFNVTGRYPELLALAQAKPDDQVGIDAIRMLLNKQQGELLKSALGKAETAGTTAQALGNAGDAGASALLLPIVQDDKQPVDVRRKSIRGAALSKDGAAAVLKLATEKKFDDTFTPALAAALTGSPFPNVRDAAQKLFPAPAGKNDKPLPPLVELAKLKGDRGRGQQVFGSQTAKCASCHQVNGQGKEVGPNLSEIGSKLSRQAMFESIVFPSAGISHNFESYVAVLNNGTITTGLKISDDNDSVTLKDAEAKLRTFKKSEIDEIKKQDISLMPADLAKQMTVEELADVVEYLTTLKKK